MATPHHFGAFSQSLNLAALCFLVEVTEMKATRMDLNETFLNLISLGERERRKKYPNVGKTARREKKNGLRLANIYDVQGLVNCES